MAAHVTVPSLLRSRLMMQATQIVGFHTDAFAGVDHRLQLVGGAQGQMPAMIHDENAVADLLDLLHVMLV